MAREFCLFSLCALAALQLGPADAAKGLQQRVWGSQDRTKDQGSYFPEKTNLNLDVQLKGISNFDPKSGSLAVSYYLTQLWNDPTIAWDMRDTKVSSITVPSDKLWIPDIVPYSAESHEKVFETRLTVFSDGSVMKVDYLRTRVTCEKVAGKITRRRCSIEFGSWTYTGNQLNVTLRGEQDGKLDLSKASLVGLEESGWEYDRGNFTRKVTYYRCCEEPFINANLDVTIRRTGGKKEEEEEEEVEVSKENKT